MSRRIRVVHCLDSLEVGGTEVNAVKVVERLDPTRFDVSVACFRDSGSLRERLTAARVRVDHFPLRSLYGPSMLRAGLRFMSFLRREQVDVVHAHDLYSNMFSVSWARVARVPGIIASRRWGAIGRLHGAGNRVGYALASRVLANSRLVGESLAASGIPRHRIVVIPNFVDDDAFAPPPEQWIASRRRELGIAQNALVIGAVANLREVKDHGTLIRALSLLRANFPSVALVIMGEGPARMQLQSLISKLQLDDFVRMPGSVANFPNPHHIFDISALCSLSEGFPNSLVEAMAARRPVVATNVGGVPDAVEHAVTGWLVPAGDPAAIADALAKLLANPQQRSSFGRCGESVARASFAARVVIPTIESLYEELLHTQSREPHAQLVD